MTQFTAGQTVRAVQSSQGMVADRKYRIVAVHEHPTVCGTLVTYELDDAPRPNLEIVNGHLLLQATRITGGI